MKRNSNAKSFLKKHSLGLTALTVVVVLILLYSGSNPDTHLGAFFGNAIADWSGVLVTIIMTKFLYERGSRESKPLPAKLHSATWELLREHSLTVFLVVTGLGWVFAFRAMDVNGRWGQVVGNLVSEWTQILGLVLLTKKLIEAGSKEDAK